MTAETEPVRTPFERLRTLVVVDGDAPSAPPPELLFRRRVSLSRTLGELWAARGVIRTLAERGLRVRYKQAVLGFAWVLVAPIGMLVAFTIVFHRAAHVSTTGVPYPLFAFMGLVPWMFFAASLSTGASSVIADRPLLNKSYFPRAVFPISTTAVAAVDASIALLPLAVLYGIEGRLPGWHALLAPLSLLVLLPLALGSSLALSAITVYFRDVRMALPLVVQMGLFVTPIGYGMSVIPAALRMPYSFVDPVAPAIDALRRTLLFDQSPSWPQLGVAALAAVLALAGGYWLFKRLEPGFADVA